MDMDMDWLRKRKPRTRHEVTLYHRPGCHLCEDVLVLLEQLSANYPMTISRVDITGDPALLRKYDIRIPVVVIDQSVELEAPISEEQLRRALR